MKIGFWRKVKMSRKRVFLVFLKVQGPRFSCKPNIAFFMGYPLYPGSDEMRKGEAQIMLFISIMYNRQHFLRSCNLYGRGLWRIGAGLPQLER